MPYNDPPVALSIAPPQAANGIGQFGQALTALNSLNQFRLFQQTFAAKARAGELLAGSDPANPEAGIQALLKDPLTAGFAPDIINSLRAAELAQVQIQGQQQEQSQKGLEGFMRGLPSVAADPSQWQANLEAHLATLSPTARGRVSTAAEAIRRGLTDGLPEGPAARSAFNNRLVGMLYSTPGITPDIVNGLFGTPTTQNIGSAIVPGVQHPSFAGGAFVPGGSPLAVGVAPKITMEPTGPGGALQPILSGGIGGGVSVAPTLPGGVPLPAGGAPAAPIQGQTQTQSTLNTDLGKAAANYKTSLDEIVLNEGKIMRTVQEAREALGNFKSGGGASTYQKVAQFAQAVGAPQTLVDRISNGDLSASQEFNKLMVNTTMGQIKQQLEGVGGSRLSEKEFDTFNRNNPNIDTDPRAIEKIFNFWTKLYRLDRTEQEEYNRFRTGGGDVTLWPQKWQQMAQERKLIETEVREPTKGPTMRWDPQAGKLVPIR